jgi:S1-C subfamily serine protease
VLGACATAGPPLAQVKAQKSFDYNKRVAVHVQVWADVKGEAKEIGLASGVYLGINGVILTNRHVAENKIPEKLASIIQNVRLKVCLVAEGKADPCQDAQVVAISDKYDLALLQIKLPDFGPIRIRPASELMNEAEEVYARPSMGEFLKPSLVYGRFVGTYEMTGSVGEADDDDEDVVKATMSFDLYDVMAMPGSSGGPVFDLKGRLVGLVRGGVSKEGRILVVVVPSRDIRKFLAEHPELFVQHEKLYP